MFRVEGGHLRVTTPVDEWFVPIGAAFDGTVLETVAAGEGWAVANAIDGRGRVALVVDEGTLAELMPPDERSEYGKRIYVFDSTATRAAFVEDRGW